MQVGCWGESLKESMNALRETEKLANKLAQKEVEQVVTREELIKYSSMAIGSFAKFIFPVFGYNTILY